MCLDTLCEDALPALWLVVYRLAWRFCDFIGVVVADYRQRRPCWECLVLGTLTKLFPILVVLMVWRWLDWRKMLIVTSLALGLAMAVYGALYLASPKFTTVSLCRCRWMALVEIPVRYSASCNRLRGSHLVDILSLVARL